MPEAGCSGQGEEGQFLHDQTEWWSGGELECWRSEPAQGPKVEQQQDERQGDQHHEIARVADLYRQVVKDPAQPLLARGIVERV